MTILFIANRFPYPPFRGDKLKIYNLTKRLSGKHKLILLTFYEQKSELDDLKHLEPFFTKIITVYLPRWKSVLNCIPALFSKRSLQIAYFKSGAMANALKKLLDEEEIDVIHTQHLRMSQYTKDIEISGIKRILDLPDAYSLYWKRRNTTDRPWYLRLLDKVEISRLVREEAVIRKFDLTLVCSQEDKIYLEKLHKADNIKLLLNGVDLDTFDVGEGHDYSKSDTLLFTGNMDYAPNVDAVQYFVSDLLPEIRAKVPGVTFVIAGQRPVPAVKKLVSKDVKITGFVPDLKDMYKSASVLVAPLRFGAGTQNKVLEAMAMGLPVVCTEIGFEGLEIKSGQGVFLAKQKEAFISTVINLLQSQDLRENTGLMGLQKARDKFSWDIIASTLDSYCEQLISKEK
ncbi:glycosyltransferase [bacterium]|nr:glycosyltransferase [bacterium]